MPLDPAQLQQLAAAAAVTLAPFTPYLTQAGTKLAEEIGEKLGGATWEKAKAIWNKIKTRLGDDAEVKNAAGLVAASPDDEGYRTTLAQVLGKKLAAHPDLADDLVALFGGFDVVLDMTARAGGVIVGSSQKAAREKAHLKMTAEGQDSGIYDSTQEVE